MNFTSKVKNEILSDDKLSPCCKLVALSAFLRTAGTVEIKNGMIGFSIFGDSETILYFQQIILDLYKVSPIEVSVNPGERIKAVFLSDKTYQILKDCEILKFNKGGLDIILDISDKLIKKACCKKAYVKGAFLGSGSITVPKMKSEKATGYHLEFVFSKYLSARDFCNILSDNGLIAKLIERKDSFVVYTKSSEEICDLLVLMGAKKSCLELQDIIVKKMVKNNTNRIVNCEISNLNKQVDASCKSRTDIQTIQSLMGIDNLPAPLKTVAEARLNYPDDSLSQLAEKLEISKSCLCHRLKRLSSIADSL